MGSIGMDLASVLDLASIIWLREYGCGLSNVVRESSEVLALSLIRSSLC